MNQDGKHVFEVRLMTTGEDGKPAIDYGTVRHARFEVGTAGALLFFDTPGTAAYPEPARAFAPGVWLSVGPDMPND